MFVSYKYVAKGITVMNRNTLRWILVAIMIMTLVFTLSCPYIVEAEGSALPLNYLEGGKPSKDEGWTFEGKLPVSYEDSTISVTFERDEVSHVLSAGSYRGSKVKDETWVVRIKIKDPSQLRTAVARDTYTKSSAEAEDIANSKNAVVAMNGDFFKYENDVGYVVRQGELIRDLTNNSRGRIFDMLIIDSEGDFHVVYSATTEKIDAYVEENLTPQGRTILDTFNIGPVLVLNGEVQDISESEAVHQNTYEWSYPIQRICIVQTGPLEYAIVETGGKGKQKSGFTMQEFAEYVAEKCPDAILAYNLDGGGSASLIARTSAKSSKGKMLCSNPGHRPIFDILYFASAED